VQSYRKTERIFEHKRKDFLGILLRKETQWGKESYTDEYTRKGRMGIIWLKAGIWKLRGIRRGFDKSKVPPMFGGEGC
jgi:hypothetical protein